MFDHIEVCNKGLSYDDLANYLSKKTATSFKHPHHTTHDIDMYRAFRIKLTQFSLIEKIIREEMRRWPLV